jgi:hypothetical protein
MKKVAEVLDGLREEERRLSVELSGVRRAIGALEEVLGIVPERTEGAAAEPPLDSGPPAPADEPGPYAIPGLYQAAEAYLRTVGEPRTSREIAEALQAGGYRTRARNFSATVRTTLRRDSAKSYGIYPTKAGGRWFVRD